jgi:hypothetical protein
MDEYEPNSFTHNKIKHRWVSAGTRGPNVAPAEIEGVTRARTAT